jgi:hypothetical protein
MICEGNALAFRFAVIKKKMMQIMLVTVLPLHVWGERSENSDGIRNAMIEITAHSPLKE